MNKDMERVPEFDSAHDLGMDLEWTSERLAERHEDSLRQERFIEDCLGEYQKQRANVVVALDSLLETGRMSRDEETRFLRELRGLLFADIDLTLAGDSDVDVEEVSRRCARLGELLLARRRPNSDELQKTLRSSEDEIRIAEEMLADLRRNRCERIEELHDLFYESLDGEDFRAATIECEILEREEQQSQPSRADTLKDISSPVDEVLRRRQRASATLLTNTLMEEDGIPDEDEDYIFNEILDYLLRRHGDKNLEKNAKIYVSGKYRDLDHRLPSRRTLREKADFAR